MTTVIIRRAEVDGRLVDVTWADGAVVEVTSAGAASARRGHEELDAQGGAVVPGLHDHHLHLLALAATQGAVRAGPPEVRSPAQLADALTQGCRRSTGGGWVRAVGYHESVAGQLDAAVLDTLLAAGGPSLLSVPVRVQHRSGRMWMFNRSGMAAAGIDRLDHPGVERYPDGTPTGRVFGADDALRGRLNPEALDLATTAATLATYGVTGVTDLTPTAAAADAELIAAHALDPAFPIRVVITGGADLSPAAGEGLPRGPVKLLPSDREPIDLDMLVGDFRSARATGRSIAVHCVTRIGLVVALAAFDEVGVRSGDRIEHGAVVPDDLIGGLRDRGLIVVTQPNFVAERGDEYLTDVETDDLPHLWRCRSLLDGGVAVAGSTDAPFGHPDPWRAIAAATTRRAPSGASVGPVERLDAASALALFSGEWFRPPQQRHVAAGSVTDLCVLRVPLREALAEPSSTLVAAVVGRAGLKVVRDF